MKAIHDLLADRKRSQRGSVLSGVLIMTAFIAIISGALMTELSGSFLLSNSLMNRINNQATVNSAMELALSQMQTNPINSGCPNLNSVTLNGVTALPTYTSCWPTVSEQPQFARYVAASAFNVDGSHAVISRAGLNLYTVADSAGNVYQFSFGQSMPNWSSALGGSVSGPPLTMADVSESDINDISTLVPLSYQANPPSACQQGGCVALLPSDWTSSPDSLCYMAAEGQVTAQPADGVNNPNVAFFGDQTGNLYAYLATETGNCASQASPVSIGQPVVAGPVIFAGPVTGNTRVDEIYLLTSDGSSSWLRRFAFTSKNGQPGSLSAISSLQLPAANAVHLAVDQSTLPARLAITFAGGTVSLTQIQSSFGMVMLGTTQLPAGIVGAPAWCCASSPTLIGVAAINGLFVLDANLNVVASYGISASVSTSPAPDSAADWFFGASDGNLYEVPAVQSTPTVLTLGGGQLGRVGSSVQVGSCGGLICAYLASANDAYRFQLDARQAVISACISTSPPACSGANPRLRANVQVGAAGNQQAVHVQGWSYYSG